jgi:hypothetical protein
VKLFRVTVRLVRETQAIVCAEDVEDAVSRHPIDEVFGDDREAGAYEVDDCQEVTSKGQIPHEWRGSIPLGDYGDEDEDTAERMLETLTAKAAEAEEARKSEAARKALHDATLDLFPPPEGSGERPAQAPVGGGAC